MTFLLLLIQEQWLMPVAPAPRTLRQGDLKLEVSLGCMVRPCLKDKTKQNTNKNA